MYFLVEPRIAVPQKCKQSVYLWCVHQGKVHQQSLNILYYMKMRVVKCQGGAVVKGDDGEECDDEDDRLLLRR